MQKCYCAKRRAVDVFRLVIRYVWRVVAVLRLRVCLLFIGFGIASDSRARAPPEERISGKADRGGLFCASRPPM